MFFIPQWRRGRTMPVTHVFDMEDRAHSISPERIMVWMAENFTPKHHGNL